MIIILGCVAFAALDLGFVFLLMKIWEDTFPPY